MHYLIGELSLQVIIFLGRRLWGFGFATALYWRFAGDDFWDEVVFFTARLARGAQLHLGMP